MTYLLYLVMTAVVAFACKKVGLQISDHVMLILAILTAGEVMSWRLWK